MKPDSERNAVRPPETFLDVGLSLEDVQLLLYITEGPRPGSVYSFYVKKRKPLPSMMSAASQSMKVTRTSLEEGLKVAADRPAKVENIFDVRAAASDTL